MSWRHKNCGGYIKVDIKAMDIDISGECKMLVSYYCCRCLERWAYATTDVSEFAEWIEEE